MRTTNLKTLLAAYRATLDNPIKTIDDDAICIRATGPSDDVSAARVRRILAAIVADMRAEDEAAAKKGKV